VRLAGLLAPLVVVALGALAAGSLDACGIGVEGSMAATDAAAPLDGGTDASLPPPPTCTPVVLKDALSTIDAAVWREVRDGSNGTYPQIVPSPESPFSSPALSLVKPAAPSSRGGIWLQTRVPTRAFDVTLSFQIKCTAPCAEGLAVVWLNTTDANVLDSAASGRGFGIPPTVAGAAVAIDLARNSETGEGPTPSVSLLSIDGAQNPGDYAWAKPSGPADTTLVSGLRKLEIHARAGNVEVRVDGVLAVSGPSKLGFQGLFGVTAATGGDVAEFFVRDFSGSFYACDP
jgi:hypothetical protein